MNKSLDSVFLTNPKRKLHYLVGNDALVGKISFGSTKDTDVKVNDWAGCCNPVCDVRVRNGGGVELCRASLSGMDWCKAMTGLVLRSGGRPGLEGEPNVKKRPLGPSVTHKAFFLCSTGLRQRSMSLIGC